MDKYTGQKWFHNKKLDTQVKNVEYDWGYDVPKYKTQAGFSMTAGYAKYCAEKRAEKRRQYIETLRNKLEWQMKTYGEVDDVDYGEFCAYLNGKL